MVTPAPSEFTKIMLGGKEEVVIDPAHLKFDERTLSDWLINEAGWYNYYAGKLQLAEAYFHHAEMNLDILRSGAIQAAKKEGAAVAIAEAIATTNEDVIKAQKAVYNEQYKVGVLKTHLKAWDKAHDAAISLSHTLRKELDKLGNDIYLPGGLRGTSGGHSSSRIDQLVEECEGFGVKKGDD
jgi:hypothetical protein